MACVLLGLPASCMLMLYVAKTAEHRTRYDANNLDYQYVASKIQMRWQPVSLDLSRINGGDWQFVCVIGGYKDPVKILRDEAARRGITTTSIDSVATPLFGLYPVEECEGAISFVDRAGRGRTILIDGCERITQRSPQCFGPDTREVVLPLSDK